MRPDVFIVLNEREAFKAQSAAKLEERLQSQQILTKRILPKENVKEVILKGRPKIVVLDYLLGDFTTGLDLLEILGNSKADCDSEVIFLTDEPSIQVAVSALRMGAVNYFELDDPTALEQTTAEIKKVLGKQEIPPATRPIIPPLGLKDLVAIAETSKEMLRQAYLNSIKKPPITVIVGAAGTGRSTLANAILNHEKASELFIKQVDLAISLENSKHLLGLSPHQKSGVMLGRNLSLVLNHAEADQTDLLKTIEGNYHHIWPSGRDTPVDGRLILITNSPETTQAWKSLLQAEIISVPNLTEREEDFASLVQAFHHHAQTISKKKIQPCPAKLVTQLSIQKWPGEIRQLKSVIIDALISSTFEEIPLETLIENGIIRWEQDQQASPAMMISPLGAGLLLQDTDNDYRITAAKLGIGIKDLKQMLTAS